MTLKYQTTKYDLEKGLEEGVDGLQLQTGAALELVNVRHRVHGGWSRRFGLTAITKNELVNAGAAVYTSETSGLYLAPGRSNRGILFGNSAGKLFTFDSAGNAWHAKNSVPNCIGRERQILSWDANITSYDSVYVNGYIIYLMTGASQSGTQDLFFAAVDATNNQVVIPMTRIFAGTPNPIGPVRLCTVGNFAFAAWEVAAATTITAGKLDCTTILTLSAGWLTATVSAAVIASTPFDICAGNDGLSFFVAFEGSGGAPGLLLKKFDLSMTNTGTATISTDVGYTAIGLCQASAETRIWVSWAIGVVVRYGFADSSTLAVGSPPTGSLMYTNAFSVLGGNIRRITCARKDSTNVWVGFSADGSQSLSGTNQPAGILTFLTARWNYGSTAGVLGSGSNTTALMCLSDFGILSKIFIYNSRFYQWVGLATTTQPSWYLVEVGDFGGAQPPIRQVCYEPRIAYQPILRQITLGATPVTPGPVNVMAPDGNTIECIALYQSGSAAIVSARRLRAEFDHETIGQNTKMSSITAFSGMLSFDGERVSEYGFDCYPESRRYDIGGVGTGSMGVGTYQYCWVDEYTDSAGNLIRSGVSDVVTIVQPNAMSSITFYDRGLGLTIKQQPLPPALTGGTSSPSAVARRTYRTISNGPIFFLENIQSVASTKVTDNVLTGPSATNTYKDDLSEVQLTALGYGQLYTTGDRQPFLPVSSMRALARTSTRLWGLSTNDYSAYYSEVEVTGVLSQFNPVQIVKLNEPIVGIAAHLDQVYLLAESNVYHIVGDGLDPKGGGQAPYPSQLNMAGCISARSIVATDDGIFYRTNSFIDVIGGDRSSEPMGEKVKDELAANPWTNDAVYYKEGNEIRWAVSPSRTSTTGIEIVYHTIRKAWSINKYMDVDQGLSSAAIKAYTIAIDPTTGQRELYALFGGGQVYRVDDASYLDGGTFVEMRIGLPFIHGDSAQTIGRIGRLALTGRVRSPSSLIVEMSYNLSDSFEPARTWLASALAGKTNVELLANPGRKCDSFRVRVRDTQPDAGPLGTGEGFWLSEVAFEVGFEPELGKVAATSLRR